MRELAESLAAGFRETPSGDLWFYGAVGGCLCLLWLFLLLLLLLGAVGAVYVLRPSFSERLAFAGLGALQHDETRESVFNAISWLGPRLVELAPHVAQFLPAIPAVPFLLEVG